MADIEKYEKLNKDAVVNKWGQILMLQKILEHLL